MYNRIIGKLKIFFWPREKYARSLGVKIGKGCDIQDVTFGSEPYLITIGDNVQITNGTKIFTHGGGWVLRKKYPNLDFFGKVEIKNNVYVGNDCLILPGVQIGNNVIIGAGSVVTKSVPDGCIVAGNPAKIVGDINSFEEYISQYNVGTKGMTYFDKRRYLLNLNSNLFISKGYLTKC